MHFLSSMHYSGTIKKWLLTVVIPIFLLSTFPGMLCSQSGQRSIGRFARETDASVGANQTQLANGTGGDGGAGNNGAIPFTIYPPPTTIKEADGLGFTAETGSTGSPFLQVKASPPTTGAMTGSASTKPMIIIGGLMLVGCVGGGVYLWYLRSVKMGAEQAGGGGGGEFMEMQGGEENDASYDPDDEEDAVPE